MESEGYVKFTRGLTTSTNGVDSTEYKIEFLGTTVADAYEAREYLKEYVKMVKDLLSDYPEDEYYLYGREELKVKIKLAKTMIENINKL